MGEALELFNTHPDLSQQSTVITATPEEAARLEADVAALLRTSPNALRDVTDMFSVLTEDLLPRDPAKQDVFLSRLKQAQWHALTLLAAESPKKRGNGVIARVCRVAIVDCMPDLAKSIDAVVDGLRQNPDLVHDSFERATLRVVSEDFRDIARDKVVKALVKKAASNKVSRQFDAALQMSNDTLRRIITSKNAETSPIIIDIEPVRCAVDRTIAFPMISPPPTHHAPQQLRLHL